MWWFLVGQQSVESVFLERGILGAIVLVLGTFAWITIKQLRTDLHQSLDRERLQQEQIYTKVIPTMERLSAAVEARAAIDQMLLAALQDVRRLLERQGE